MSASFMAGTKPSNSACRRNSPTAPRLPRAAPRQPSNNQKSTRIRTLAVSLRQKGKVGAYIVRQHLAGRKRYPLVLMLEPLFRCNLACAGCGKIDYPGKILNQRLSVADCLEAVDECGAPVVSIAGGEPLLYKELPQVVKEIV